MDRHVFHALVITVHQSRPRAISALILIFTVRWLGSISKLAKKLLLFRCGLFFRFIERFFPDFF
jgi:hypothetical protein